MDSSKIGIILLFCFATQIFCDQNLPNRTFRCRNGTYIDEELVCDGQIDCIQAGDGFDENFGGCNSDIYCRPGQFECDDKTSVGTVCKNVIHRCNTIIDCSLYEYSENHVDEDDCGDEIQVDDCFLNKGKYLCDDGLRCLNITDTCDGVCNCFDCSDEKFGCTIGDETSKPSHQACFKTPNGPFCCSGYDSLCQQCNTSNICEQKCVKFANEEKCICDENYVGVAGTNNARSALSNNNKDSHLDDIKDESSQRVCFNTTTGTHCCSKYDTTCQECDSNDICDQKCVQFANQTGCLCDENYFGVPGTNNAKCFPRYDAAKEKLLIRSTSIDINAINLFTKQNFTVLKEPVDKFYIGIIAAAHNYVYFTTTDYRMRCRPDCFIFRTSLLTNETLKIISTNNLILSLAVDWITGNVYYSTNKSLSVCTSRGEICKTLKSSKSNRYFVNLAPRFGLMFWFQRVNVWRTKICNLMKSSMDGTNETLLLSMDFEIPSVYYLKQFYDVDDVVWESPCTAMWTVDESTERIYWFNASAEEIQSVDFNGEKRMIWPFHLRILNRITMQFAKDPSDPWVERPLEKTTVEYGSIFENEVFFTDEGKDTLFARNEIWSVKKNSKIFARRYPPGKYLGLRAIETYYGLPAYSKCVLVYNPLLHRTKIPNPCPASCKELCLTSPSSSENTLNYTCVSGNNSGNSVQKTSAISIGAIFGVILATWYSL